MADLSNFVSVPESLASLRERWNAKNLLAYLQDVKELLTTEDACWQFLFNVGDGEEAEVQKFTSYLSRMMLKNEIVMVADYIDRHLQPWAIQSGYVQNVKVWHARVERFGASSDFSKEFTRLIIDRLVLLEEMFRSAISQSAVEIGIAFLLHLLAGDHTKWFDDPGWRKAFADAQLLSQRRESKGLTARELRVLRDSLIPEYPQLALHVQRSVPTI